MRRELKALSVTFRGNIAPFVGHKAYPDEKGTESRLWISFDNGNHFSHKAYPDEKGTESKLIAADTHLWPAGHKAYPDEKGTER